MTPSLSKAYESEKCTKIVNNGNVTIFDAKKFLFFLSNSVLYDKTTKNISAHALVNKCFSKIIPKSSFSLFSNSDTINFLLD